MKKLIPACQSGLTFLFVSHLLTFRHLREIVSQGNLIIEGKKERAMREILFSKHMHSLSLTCTNHPAEREGAQKTSLFKKKFKN